MIRSLLTTILACAVLALCGGTSQAASLNLGLCEGEMATSGVSKTGSGTVQVAIVLPASEFSSCVGASLSKLRVGLCLVEGISNVKGWVRTSLEGENLCTATFDNPVAGWNEMSFDAPCDYTLKADEDLVIGYQFDQSKSTKCISLAGRKSDDCYWLARNGSWQNNSANAPGAVSVELVVEGDMLPSTNLAIESYSFDKVVAYGEPFHAQVIVRNVAKNPVAGYKLQYQLPSNNEIVTLDRSDVSLEYRQRDTLDITIDADQQLPDQVLCGLNCSIEAAGDEVEADNSCLLYLTNYTVSYPHLLLMEEFTTEECSNCPRAINTLAQMVNEGYVFAQVSHHVGYYTDYLTVDEDKTYLWLYGEDGSFAPAGMFDRTWNRDFHPLQLRETPVFSIGYAETFRPALEKALALPAFAKVTPTLSYNETSRQLSLDVNVEKALVLDALTDEARLTVYLLEDSLPAQHQAGISSSSFRHRHVYRKCLTEMWGDVLTWEGNQATVHLEYTIPADWNAEKVSAVAFVNNYNPDDRNDCQVFNTAVVELFPTEDLAIRTIIADDAESPAYNLMGQPVKGNSRGLAVRNGHISLIEK